MSEIYTGTAAPSMKKWMALYDEGGIEGLAEASRRDIIRMDEIGRKRMGGTTQRHIGKKTNYRFKKISFRKKKILDEKGKIIPS